MNEDDSPNLNVAPSASGVTMLDRIYTFTVISAALFFLATAFWPSKGGKNCVVETVWSYVRSGSDVNIGPEEIDQITHAIKSPESIRSAIQTVSPSIEERGYATWEQAVAESVAVNVHPDSTSGKVNIHVRAGGNNEEFCRKLVATLQEQFHQSYHLPAHASGTSDERDQRKKDVVSALKQLDKQQSVIEKFLETKIGQAKSAATSGRDGRRTGRLPEIGAPTATATAVPSGLPTTSSKLASVEIANPEYAKIQSELSALEAKALVLGSPAENPVAKTVAMAAKELRELLELTPSTLPIEENWTVNPYASADGSQTITNPYASKDAKTEEISLANRERPVLEVAANTTFDAYAVEQSIRGSKEFKALTKSLDVAKQRHDAALDALANTPEPTNAGQEVELIQPPMVVSRFRTGLKTATLWRLLGPSCLLGLVCAAFCARRETPNTFYSGNDVSTSLGLPVIGAITTDRGPVVTHPKMEQRPGIRWARRAAEVALIAAILALIYSLATFEGFSDLISKDPFGGLLTSIDQIKSLIMRPS